MKRILVQLLPALLAAATARADTSLVINPTTPFGCLQNAFLWPTPLTASGSFTLSGVAGSGHVNSSVSASAPSFSYPPEIYFFNYSIDLSSLPAASNHCVKLLIHFGAPQGCDVNEVWGNPAAIQSATLAPFGDVTFVFGGGCLSPHSAAVGFTMFSEAAPKTNFVTVIDDYVDLASGTTNESRFTVPAIVPDIPPNPPPWVFYHPQNFTHLIFQGDLVGTNQVNTNLPPITGDYDFTLQLVTSATLSNLLVVSQTFTQTVQVVNGLFTVPLPFDPVGMCDGSARFLRIGVRPSGANTPFTPLNPPLPISPAPQSFFAHTAGVVADLTPGQAVTSLNGLTDAVNLQAGNGIIIGTGGNNIIISTQPGVPSDRNLKTDFAPIQPAEILSRLARLPISSWRYTNELAGIRHVGPMAQDFRQAFGLGSDDTFIPFVDEQGVALTAIQELNRQLDALQKEVAQKDAANAALKQELSELKELILKMQTRKEQP